MAGLDPWAFSRRASSGAPTRLPDRISIAGSADHWAEPGDDDFTDVCGVHVAEADRVAQLVAAFSRE